MSRGKLISETVLKGQFSLKPLKDPFLILNCFVLTLQNYFLLWQLTESLHELLLPWPRVPRAGWVDHGWRLGFRSKKYLRDFTQVLGFGFRSEVFFCLSHWTQVIVFLISSPYLPWIPFGSDGGKSGGISLLFSGEFPASTSEPKRRGFSVIVFSLFRQTGPFFLLF